jgi:hypothetical protein
MLGATPPVPLPSRRLPLRASFKHDNAHCILLNPRAFPHFSTRLAGLAPAENQHRTLRGPTAFAAQFAITRSGSTCFRDRCARLPRFAIL